MSRITKRQHAVNSTRSPAGDALSELVVLVFQLSGLLLRTGDKLTAPTGQSSARWQVLAAAESGTRSVAQIARALSLTRQSVQRVADLLERDGLAEYQKNPAHARADILKLRAAGLQALQTIQEAQRLWADSLAVQIGEGKLKQANKTLHDLLQLMRTQEGTADE